MYKFQDNTQTQYIIDAILDMDARADDEISETEFWKNIEHPTPFQDGIDNRIVKLGYNGKPDDVSAKVRFITERFNKLGIAQVSSATLKNWYTSANPDDNKNSRENVYRLCFALEMNAIETAEFFFKAYQTRPFNYKDTSEAVYYWCLLNEKSYADAVRLIAEMESVKTETRADREIATEELGSEISYISDETELVKYLSEHRYDKSEQHMTVTDKIIELLERCYAAASLETKYSDEPQKADGDGTLLKIIFGYDEEEMGKETIAKSRFPKALKANWPRRQTFENIKKHNIGAEDAYRKALVLLTFYDFYANAYIVQRKNKSEDEIDMICLADEFLTELDETLAECGYVQLYPRNPFDGLIYFCTSYPNPLSRFRDLIEEFYLDDTGHTEIKT